VIVLNEALAVSNAERDLGGPRGTGDPPPLLCFANIEGMAQRTLPVKIRPARAGDMPAIRELIRLFPEQLVQQNLPRVTSFFVATISGRVIGCCALQVYSKRIAEVRSLSVHPEFQDHGVASKLVEQCVKRGRERGVRELFAVTSHTSFFERLGFATFRREKTAMFFELAPPRG
jgi:amino-acid N-acetyltransferase